MADLLDGVRDVLGEALAQGGTSFDSLYVDVNGQSGYFSRFLAVYGQARPAVPALRDADPPRVVHEPVELQLPAAASRARAPGRVMTAARSSPWSPGTCRASATGGSSAGWRPTAGAGRLGAQPARRPGRGRARGAGRRRRARSLAALYGPRAPGHGAAVDARDDAGAGEHAASPSA